MSREAGGVWGCKPHSNRRGKEHGPAKSLLRAEQASPDFYAEQELRSSCPAKHSDPIAKHIMNIVEKFIPKLSHLIPNEKPPVYLVV